MILDKFKNRIFDNIRQAINSELGSSDGNIIIIMYKGKILRVDLNNCNEHELKRKLTSFMKNNLD